MNPKTPEWSEWRQPNMQNTRMICCDCGLSHDVQFRAYGVTVEFRVKRNNRSTAAVRREDKKKRDR